MNVSQDAQGSCEWKLVYSENSWNKEDSKVFPVSDRPYANRQEVNAEFIDEAFTQG